MCFLILPCRKKYPMGFKIFAIFGGKCDVCEKALAVELGQFVLQRVLRQVSVRQYNFFCHGQLLKFPKFLNSSIFLFVETGKTLWLLHVEPLERTTFRFHFVPECVLLLLFRCSEDVGSEGTFFLKIYVVSFEPPSLAGLTLHFRWRSWPKYERCNGHPSHFQLRTVQKQVPFYRRPRRIAKSSP